MGSEANGVIEFLTTAELPSASSKPAIQAEWRRERDSNPRTFQSTVFKTVAIDHSAIPPGRS